MSDFFGARPTLFLTVFLAAPAGFAQTFTPQDYVRQALQKSPEVASAWQGYVATLADERGAWGSAWLPQLSASSQWYLYGINPFVPTQSLKWNMNSDNSSYFSQISLNVFNSFQDSRTIKEKEAAVEEQKAAFDQARQDKALAAWNAYLGLFTDQKLKQIAETDLASRQGQDALTRDLYRQGMKSESDVLQSRSDLDSSRLNLISADASYQKALYQFNSFLGRDPQAQAELAPPQLPDGKDLATDSESVSRALRDRPEMHLSNAQVQAALLQQSQSFWGFFPAIALGGTYSESKSPTFGEYGLGSGLQRPIYDVTLSAALPANFNGFSQWQAYAQSRALSVQTQANRETLGRQLGLQALSAATDFKAAIAAYQVNVDRDGIMHKNLGLNEERYRMGGVDALYMTQVRADFLQAENSLAQAVSDAALKQVSYLYAIGEPLW